jgi:uncharacterized protein (DUF885 family)
MKKLALLLLVTVIIASCNQENKNNYDAVRDQQFDSYKNRFVEELWKVYPTWATEIGYHKYDSNLVAPTELNRHKQIEFAKEQLDSLHSYKLKHLSDLNKIDYHLMEDLLKGIQWNINEMKSWQWDPSMYNACGNVSYILGENYERLDERLKNLNIKLSKIPAYYEAAKLNIHNPSKEHTQLAIDQNLGGVYVFETDMMDSVRISGLDDATKQSIITNAKAAAKAVYDYTDHLKNLKNDQPRSFRLGKDLYPKKFAFDIQSNSTSDEIYRSALERKAYLHKKMAELSEQLWPKYFVDQPKPKDALLMIRKMIDTLSVHHTKPEEFQSTIAKQIPELEAFIKKKNLIYLDPSKPLKVRKEPAYMAGVAGASISAPGPYDKNGNTYYNVGSLSGWPAEKSESYLREYNDYILQILNIHEAIPGHYTQLVYSNNSPSIIKSVLGNGAMIEGWAVYGELMMLENGYGNNEPEMWLMYYKWNLRTVCNTILDISVHMKDMSKEQALDLLTREAFQQQAEAEGKWKRVTLSSVQLCSYYTGFKEIVDLREEYKKKMGDQFDLKEFHEKFLSYGSSPVKYIREMMLEE